MIHYVEGCTCAGKTTLCKTLLETNPNWIMAPEHTPQLDLSRGFDDCQRQVFKSFMKSFEELLEVPEKDFLCDYSPEGVIAFDLALALTYKNGGYFQLCQTHSREWFNFCLKHRDQMQMVRYLHEEPEVIIDRLKTRGRLGDDNWDKEFINNLVFAYQLQFTI